MSNPSNPVMQHTSALRNALMMLLQIVDANSDREIRLPEDGWNLCRDLGWVTCSDVRVPGPDGVPENQRRFLLTKLGKRELEAQHRWMRQQDAAQRLGVDGPADGGG